MPCSEPQCLTCRCVDGLLCGRAKLADAKEALRVLEEEEAWQKDAKLDEVRRGIVHASDR